MTLEEFNDWLQTHAQVFPVVARAFGEKADKSRERMWFQVLGDFDFADVQAATEAMLSDESLQPSRLEQHPARIKKLAAKAATGHHQKQIMARFGPGTSAGCPACKGDCWVYVAPWNDSTIRIGSQQEEVGCIRTEDSQDVDRKDVFIHRGLIHNVGDRAAGSG